MMTAGAVFATYLVGLAPSPAPAQQAAAEPVRPAKPPVVQRRIPFPAKREQEMRRYAKRHYGVDDYRLTKVNVIVEHYTVTNSFGATYNTFAPDNPDPEFHELPGTCAHYVIDRDGKIYQLVSTAVMCRHAVGLNYTSVGIEHVGNSDGQVVGNARQLRSSLALTRWLQDRYDVRTKNVIGHAEALTSPFYREQVKAFQGGTHGDFAAKTMRDYRKRLTRLPKPLPGTFAAAAAHALAALDGVGSGSGVPVRHELLGESVQGRRIEATAIGRSDAPRKALVFGAVHGNESAGIAVARRLRADQKTPKGVQLWIVDDLNPDGRRRGTRQNARGVDLNRNADYHWRRQGRQGSENYSGPSALSEPESKLARKLITRVQPDVTVWYHQALGLVDDSGGDPVLERRYAELSGLPFTRLARLPGSVTSWQNHTFPEGTAFVVELNGGALSPGAVERHAKAVRAIATGRGR